MSDSATPTVPDDISSKPPTEVAKDVTIIFLAGVAIVLGLLLVTYMIMVIMDRWCCCIPGWRAVGETVEVDHGPVARKAGLWGLRLEERHAILERILVGKTYTPDMIQCDEENPIIVPNITEETSESQDDDDDDYDSPERIMLDEKGNGEEEKVEIKEEENEEGELSDADEVNHDVVCAICLSEYVEGEMVLTGTSCNHLFHKSCAFEWLSKHDHCPYCRKEMMTADEMRTTAEELLGRDRVLEMRMWGPTQELMRNSFEEESDAPASSVNTTHSTSIELAQTQTQTTQTQTQTQPSSA